jgi:hypothetical protein
MNSIFGPLDMMSVGTMTFSPMLSHAFSCCGWDLAFSILEGFE